MNKKSFVLIALLGQCAVAAPIASAHPGSGIVVDPQGQVFFADLTRGLLKIDAHNKVTTIHKEGGHWLAMDETGRFSYPGAILKVTLEGKVTTLVNPVNVSDCEKSPPSIKDAPALRGLAIDAGGSVYAAATGCRCVVKITPDGKVATVLKAENPWSPCGVAVQGDAIFVLEHVNANSEAHEDWPPRVRKLGPDGKVTTLVAFSAGQAGPPQK